MTASPRHRWVLLAVAFASAVAAFGMLASSSSAQPWMYYDGSAWRWLHQHTYQYYFLNGVTGSARNSATEGARREWRDDTVLGLKSTGDHAQARIHAVDSNYGNTGWIGLAEGCFHCTPSNSHYNHARLNSFYSETDAGWQGVACQEIGHVIGLDHAPDGDCMAKGYFSPSGNHVGGASIGYIRSYYQSPPDGSLGHVAGGSGSFDSRDDESDWYDVLGNLL